MTLARFLFIVMISALGCTAAHAEVSPYTKKDEHDNILFVFNETPSIKVSKAGDAAAGEGCNGASEGAIRYNKHIKNVEFCDGTVWNIVSNAPQKAQAANAACMASLTGQMRYNTALNQIEVCTGANWKTMTPSKVVVDYTTCKWPLTSHHDNSLNNYYLALGSSTTGDINMACEKDFVMVAMDNAPDPHESAYRYAFCCQLKVE